MRANSSDGRKTVTDGTLGIAIKSSSLIDSPYRISISLRRIAGKLRSRSNINYRTQQKQYTSRPPEFVYSRKISTCTPERKPLKLYQRSASAHIILKMQSARPATAEHSIQKQTPQSRRTKRAIPEAIQMRKQIIIDETGTVFSRRIRR